MDTIRALWSETSGRKIILFFVTIVLLLVASLFFQKNKMNEEMELKVQFIEQKNMLRDELDDLINEHDELLDEYGDLNSQLFDKDSIIQSQIVEIRNLIRSKNDLIEARRKIAVLKEISKKYLSNIDSLLVVNENLTIEKDSVIKENKNINWKNYKLSKQNEKLAEKVSKGSILEILNIDVEGLRYRGTGKEVSTRFARKVQKLRICFRIGANQISEQEDKIVFMQLIDTKGELVIGEKIITVNISDSIFNCTTSSEFKYTNIEMNNCFEWERTQQLESGNYLINLIIEGRISGQQKFKLR
jgi:hypothetical protein